MGHIEFTADTDGDQEVGRGIIEFSYTPAEVATAAGQQAVIHSDIADAASAEADSLEAELRAKGVELVEVQQTGGARFGARVDQELGERLRVVRDRRDVHGRQRDEYLRWQRALTGHIGDTKLWLRMPDIEYFGL